MDAGRRSPRQAGALARIRMHAFGEWLKMLSLWLLPGLPSVPRLPSLSLSTCCPIWKSFKVYLPCRTLLGLDIRMEPQKTCTRDERHWQSQIFVCRPHPQWKEVDEGRGQWGRARLLGDRKKDELSVYSDIFESLFIIIMMILFVCLFVFLPACASASWGSCNATRAQKPTDVVLS